MELLSAADAEARERRAAGALLATGCGVGDRVAFCLPSSADLLCAVLGAARVGIIPVLLHATLLEAERDSLLADADPACQFTDAASLAALFEGKSVDLAEHPLTRPMHYTSGTTGRPKGVTTGVWDEETAAAVFNDEADLWGMDENDLHMVCSPMYHTVSIRFAAGTLGRGGSVAILRSFDAATAKAVLRNLRPTTAFFVPTHLHRLLDGERFDSLRLLAHAGAPCPPALKERAFEAVGDGALWEFYGSTEGQFTACSPEEWHEHPGSVGRARPGRRLIIEDGVIWCEVPDFARFEYWRNPAATDAAWRGDACSVGDMGHLDEDGYLYLSGRRDDLIITGGVNVYPAEVESVLGRVPGVTEVVVFGSDDPEWGQRVRAAYIGDAHPDQLRDAAALALAPFKRPKDITQVTEFPRTPTGKVLRRKMGETRT